MFCSVLPPLCSHRQECSSVNSSAAGQHCSWYTIWHTNGYTWYTASNWTTLLLVFYFKLSNTTLGTLLCWTILHLTWYTICHTTGYTSWYTYFTKPDNTRYTSANFSWYTTSNWTELLGILLQTRHGANFKLNNTTWCIILNQKTLMGIFFKLDSTILYTYLHIVLVWYKPDD